MINQLEEEIGKEKLLKNQFAETNKELIINFRKFEKNFIKEINEQLRMLSPIIPLKDLTFLK